MCYLNVQILKYERFLWFSFYNAIFILQFSFNFQVCLHKDFGSKAVVKTGNFFKCILKTIVNEDAYKKYKMWRMMQLHICTWLQFKLRLSTPSIEISFIHVETGNNRITHWLTKFASCICSVSVHFLVSNKRVPVFTPFLTGIRGLWSSFKWSSGCLEILPPGKAPAIPQRYLSTAKLWPHPKRVWLLFKTDEYFGLNWRLCHV